MRYLCLIYLDERELDAMPEREMSALNAEHVAFNEELRAAGTMIEAEALEPSESAVRVQKRDGRVSVTDGPFAESKEMVAGFYLIEARDMREAAEVASRIPSAHLATIEIRPTRLLIVDGAPQARR